MLLSQRFDGCAAPRAAPAARGESRPHGIGRQSHAVAISSRLRPLTRGGERLSIEIGQRGQAASTQRHLLLRVSSSGAESRSSPAGATLAVWSSATFRHLNSHRQLVLRRSGNGCPADPEKHSGSDRGGLTSPATRLRYEAGGRSIAKSDRRRSRMSRASSRRNDGRVDRLEESIRGGGVDSEGGVTATTVSSRDSREGRRRVRCPVYDSDSERGVHGAQR